MADKVNVRYIAMLEARGLIKGAKAGKKAVDGLNKSEQRLKKTSLETKIAVAAMGAAFIRLAVGFGRMLQGAADARNALGDMSKRTGVAAETLAGLQLAARSTGKQLSDLDSILNPLNARLGMVRKGNQESIDTFEAFGVAVKGAGGEVLGTEKVFRNILGVLDSYESQAKKAQVASTLLGESGAKLLDVVGNTTELDRFIKRAGGFVDVSEEGLKVSQAWQSTMAELGTAIGGAKDELFTLVGPAVIGAIQGWTKAFVFGVELISRTIDNVIARFRVLGGAIRLLDAFTVDAGSPAERVASLARGVSAATAYMDGMRTSLDQDLLSVFGDAWKKAADMFTDDAKAIGKKVGEDVGDGFEEWLKDFDGFKNAVGEMSSVDIDGKGKGANNKGVNIALDEGRPSLPGDNGADAALGILGIAGDAEAVVSILGSLIVPGLGALVVAASKLEQTVINLETGLHRILDGIKRMDNALRRIPEMILGLAERVPEMILFVLMEWIPALMELAAWITVMLPIEMTKMIPKWITMFWEAGVQFLKDVFDDLVRMFESPLRGRKDKFLGTSFKKGDKSLFGISIGNGGVFGGGGPAGDESGQSSASDTLSGMATRSSGAPIIVRVEGGYFDDAATRRLGEAFRRIQGDIGLGDRLDGYGG